MMTKATTTLTLIMLAALGCSSVYAQPFNDDKSTKDNVVVSAGEKLSKADTIVGYDQTRSTPTNEQLKAAIIRPIKQLFDGMREHNKNKIVASFAPDASLIRASHSGVLKYTDVNQFAESISKRKNDIMDERIIRYHIQRFENLATVWTYFVFYYNGKISHCGVNTIQVVHADKQWRIGSLMDTAYQGSCEEFILDFRIK
ncbi:hypothetical protein J1N51_03195 [Psychrosphaera ytuae]|uniref:Nuclear transport factor 2 family protein n=1 Tax=Psychrosphaera ytuae TaxID=2820710 RepID=A0A975HIQ8_9GAMM|nr:hypothetical protein [Psychrosphaera ytuae]QTH64497.1 hypothetical protein J1N51_03195 [Psychrosphaera ytuae]